MISAALVSLLICWEIPVGVRYLSEFDENIIENRDFIYVNQAFDFIEGSIMDAQSTAVSNNIIEVVRRDGAGSDWIRRDSSGNLIISYYKCYYSTINNIMRNAAAFSAVKTGRAVIITITTMNGRTYKKCIYINMEKAEKASSWYIQC